MAAGNTVGYVPPPLSLQHLPHGKSTRVMDSYLYLIPAVPSDETSMADTYLKLLGGVYDAIQQPNIPAPNWNNLAKQEASNLADPSANTTVTTRSYLRSYVSDTRSAPELATQASVLAGLRAYDRHTGVFIPLEYQLDSSLPSFYDPTLHTVTNVLGAGSDPNAQEESWSYVGDLISLLQVAELGSKNARNILLDSANSAITLAHTNQYSFPQDFLYKTWNRQGTGTEPDVAGGYAWLMLGLYDLTSDGRYLDEAKASIAHFAGQGFNLSYETHMTAYGAAAAERLYKMTGDKTYRGYAALALANLFHAVRLWDCTYGSCRQGKGYHTFMGLNPLPWADYTAMFEQSQAWLALRDYLQYADGEPTYITDLVRGFVQYTPIVMQYALPPLLPAGAATANPSEYSFVPHNNLQWYVPLKDLRQGESTSGAMGQEIYGAGGPFIFASAQRLTTATPLPGATPQATGAATPTGTPTP